MSKFTLTKRADGEYDLAYFNDRMWKYLFIESADLADLASCASAALAEQNSRVMAGECVCELVTNLAQNPICNKGYNGESEGLYCNNKVKHAGNEFSCAHDAACHPAQNTENQGE